MAEVVAPIIDGVSWFLRMLWAVRVSVIYALAGLLLFYGAVPAQNLMADLSSFTNWWAEIFFWGGVFVSTFVLWAFPIHYGARRTLRDDAWIVPRALRDELSSHCQDGVVWLVRERYALLIVWLPRVLGLLPFAALAIGVHGAIGAISGAGILKVTQTTRTQGQFLYAADAVTAVAFVVFVYYRQRFFVGWHGLAKVFHIVALLLTAAIFVFDYVYPIQSSVLFPRALLVPPLFGSLVLLFSELQRWGNKTGFPFLTALFAVLGLLTGLNATFNNLRTVTNTDGDQRLTFEEAIAHWKIANGCEQGQCPRPIIVAIDGGASRAAFTAATFIGEYLDRTVKNDAKDAAEPKSGDAAPKLKRAATPARRIFAISGVSGGSYGAAVIQSAIADGQGVTPPCRSAQTTWFGYQDWVDHGRRFGWRQCLQALTSGDYLSPTIIGLAFRDFAAPAWQKIPLLDLPTMKDRAGLLELAWEQQYSATLQPGTRFYEGGTDCNGDKPTGFCRPAAHPKPFFSRTELKWMPMLFLNSTSVATGRRVISADIKSKREDGGKMGSLYPEAYDLREIMSQTCPDGSPQLPKWQDLGLCPSPADIAKIDGPDVRLSTAALTSARFPIISPAGVVPMEKPDGAKASRYGDQVVDGGYFENSGLTTALNIVTAMRDPLYGLEPILVSISNNPEAAALSEAEVKACQSAHGGSLAACTGQPRRPTLTPLVQPADTSLVGRIFGILSRPLQTLLSTGNGHADEALGAAESTFLPPPGGFFRLAVDVKPDLTQPAAADADDAESCRLLWGRELTMAKVSMSWWLSASVQADLDAQRCAKGNRAVLAALLAATEIRRAPH